MTIVKLSDEVKRLRAPQQSDRFVKMLRNKVLAKELEAIYNGETFVLPKEFTDLSRTESKQRRAKDMLIRKTPAYEAWFQEVDADLAEVRLVGRAQPKITPENFMNGNLSWDEHVEATRREIKAKVERGASLGQRRRKAVSTS